MSKLTATEVSRNFSDALNRVDSGEEIVIVRNGRPIAELRRPAKPEGMIGSAFKEVVRHLPSVDDDFAGDVREARRSLGAPTSRWPASS